MEQAITVIPVAHGWTIKCAACDREVFFVSGAQAEAAARDLGLTFAQAGATAVIQIYLRDGTLGGRFVHVARGRHRRWDAPAAGVSAPSSPPAG